MKPLLIPFVLIFLILSNILPIYSKEKFPNRKTHVCHHGTKCLELFLISSSVSIIFHAIIAFSLIPDEWTKLLFSALLCIAIEAVVFWNGIISVYVSSVQLGIKIRIIGILCGFIPVANLVALGKIIHTTKQEVWLETEKCRLDLSRKDRFICKTKYPILLVHGVFFRDFRHLNYWGRIPKELETNGAVIYYGNHQSASSVKDSAAELSDRIEKIIAQTGCEKINIIAHSKGGLDCRYAIANCGIKQYVASLTTINTPQRGCLFADYLLEKVPESVKNSLIGRLDTTTAPQLETELTPCLEDATELTLDFAKLEYISSAGLRVLLSAQKIMNKQGKMALKNVNKTIMEVFEVTGFVDILTLE